MSMTKPQHQLKGFQHAVAKQIPSIRAPHYTLHKFDNFELKNIPAFFKIADFERIKQDYHVDQIRASIVKNEFYDNLIRCYKGKDGSWTVLDGQHRLAALWLLHKWYGLQRYDLIVVEYTKGNERVIYRKQNSAKPLTIANWVKSYDNHLIPFFNDLRDILSHDDGDKLWEFSSAIYCLVFAKTGTKSFHKTGTEAIVAAATETDTKFIRDFVHALQTSMPTKVRGNQFRPAFIRPCFAVAYRYHMNWLEIDKLITFGLHSDEIIKNLDNTSKATFEEQVRLFILGLPSQS